MNASEGWPHVVYQQVFMILFNMYAENSWVIPCSGMRATEFTCAILLSSTALPCKRDIS